MQSRDPRNRCEGFIPPETGSKAKNENWYTIDPQLVNEIWSMIYPGMIRKSVDRAEWGARITSDDWGTHPTLAYAVMYSTVKTTGIAVSAGLDCDNQAATCAGLMGVIHGASAIPPRLTQGLWNPVWTKPFNDTYINFTRDGLPAYNQISDMVNRILQIAEEAILSGGGKKISENGEVYYLINSDI